MNNIIVGYCTTEADYICEYFGCRIKFFEQELDRVVTINKKLKNEIRDLHNKQSNESCKFVSSTHCSSRHSFAIFQIMSQFFRANYNQLYLK